MNIEDLKVKTIDIHERADSLQKKLPVHLKMMPDIKHALALIHDMSEVLLCLTQMQQSNNIKKRPGE